MSKLLCGAALTGALLMTSVSAQAATFNLSYVDGLGGTLTALIFGDLQGDGDTVNVTGVADAAYNAVLGPLLSFVSSIEDFNGTGPVTAHLSLTGVGGSLYACEDSACADGFAFVPASLYGFDVYASGLLYGEAYPQPVDIANYSLTGISAVPLPAGFGLLFMAMGGLVALRRRKQNV